MREFFSVYRPMAVGIPWFTSLLGTVFKVGTDGVGYSQLHTFGGADGSRALGDLVVTGNKLYGMTYQGGANGRGVVFSIDPDGANQTVLHDFSDAAGNGSYPYGSLITDGVKLYGMTSGRENSVDSGTVFSMDLDGTDFQVLHEFDPIPGAEGSSPRGDLVLENGVLYGMTKFGGVNNDGVVFQLNADGTGFSLLHEFAGGALDGANPDGSLLFFNDTLYGMTSNGGIGDRGVVFSVAIPEPGTWMLAGILLATSLIFGRRTGR